MLNDTGGNAGAQTTTMIIRGMALSEIKTSDFFKAWMKELATSLIIGVCLAAVNFLRVILLYPGQTKIALVVSLSMMLVVMIAQTVAVILPMLAKRLGADPALMASPLITTIVDVLALTVYFMLAQALLGL